MPAVYMPRAFQGGCVRSGNRHAMKPADAGRAKPSESHRFVSRTQPRAPSSRLLQCGWTGPSGIKARAMRFRARNLDSCLILVGDTNAFRREERVRPVKKDGCRIVRSWCRAETCRAAIFGEDDDRPCSGSPIRSRKHQSLRLTDPLIPFGFHQQPPRLPAVLPRGARLPAPPGALRGKLPQGRQLRESPDGLGRVSSEGWSLRGATET
jgi:hypothetical protein